MSNQPIFPDVDMVMQILVGEMPLGVYATDPGNNQNTALNSYSSSEIRAHATIFANLYANLDDIWSNKFATTVGLDEISLWELNYFGVAQDASQTLAQRRSNLIAKIQATGGISYTYINTLVGNILNPLGLAYSILACTSGIGEWILDISALDVSTFLAFMDPLLGTGLGAGQQPLACNAILNIVGDTQLSNDTLINVNNTEGVMPGAGITGNGIPANTTVVSSTTTMIVMSQNATAAHTQEAVQVQNYILSGLSLSQFQDIQTQAYTYYVYIYGNASPAVISNLNQVLTAAEKAGSTHVIVNNAPGSSAETVIDPDIISMGDGTSPVLDRIDCGTGAFFTPFDLWDFNERTL